MDRRQKSTLRSLHIRIADELILDEDFYAALRRDKIFTNGMLDLIKAEAKPRDRVYKMLELLEKRGPKAFENFVWILKENYEWLAKDLEEQYNRRLQRSQQGQERNEHAYAQYETQPKYLSNDPYPKPTVSYRRTVSSPNLQDRPTRPSVVPTQESVSASFYNKDSQQFFHTSGNNASQTHQPKMQQQQQQHQQQLSYDSTDNKTIPVPTVSDNNPEPQKKQYKDACMSPIGIIESARKPVHTSCSPINPRCDEAESEESYDQSFDEILSETATVTTSTNDDVASQVTSTTVVQSEESDGVSENADAVDAMAYSELDQDDADFPTSEVYYDCVRRGSSQISHVTLDDEVFHPELCVQDDENDGIRSEISYEHSEAFQFQLANMRAVLLKLMTVTSENEETEDLGDDTVTWGAIGAEIDKLISRLENSDDTKMIRKCYKLFSERERRHPLNMCIERLFVEKKEADNRLRDKQREIDQMVFDLWKHQQDMSNIKKLRKTQAENETEINNLRTSLDNLEKDADVKLQELRQKDAKIQELQGRLHEPQYDQHKRPGVPKRGQTIQRRVSNAQGQSPRRQTTYYPDSRIAPAHTSVNSQQSPRNVTTAHRRAATNRRY